MFEDAELDGGVWEWRGLKLLWMQHQEGEFKMLFIPILAKIAKQLKHTP